VTFDDVSCLLHLPIEGMLLSHAFISRDEAVEWMKTYFPSVPGEALVEVTKTKGAHCCFDYLQRIFQAMYEGAVGVGD